MTRFVICLDGTWNNAASARERGDGSQLYRPTTVLKRARATRLGDGQGRSQIGCYDTGIGSVTRPLSGGPCRFIGWVRGFPAEADAFYVPKRCIEYLEGTAEAALPRRIGQGVRARRSLPAVVDVVLGPDSVRHTRDARPQRKPGRLAVRP